MSLKKIMVIADRLQALDPVRTYKARSLEQLKEAVAGQGACFVGSEGTTCIAENIGHVLTFEVRDKRVVHGELALYLAQPKLTEEQLKILRWAIRLFARGLSLSSRVRWSEHPIAQSQTIDDELGLTLRERQIVEHVLAGLSTKEVAAQTGLASATVNTYLKRVFSKLGVRSRVELVARLHGRLKADNG